VEDLSEFFGGETWLENKREKEKQRGRRKKKKKKGTK